MFFRNINPSAKLAAVEASPSPFKNKILFLNCGLSLPFRDPFAPAPPP
jgi:hypothetical protein